MEKVKEKKGCEPKFKKKKKDQRDNYAILCDNYYHY